MKSDSITINEAWDMIDFLKPWANVFDNPDQAGTYWAPKLGLGIGYNSYLRQFQTAYFNLAQRYLGQFLFKTNPYAQSAVTQLAVFVLGNGFEYSSDDPQVQDQLDEFIEVNNWHEKQSEIFERCVVDGECFIRTFKNNNEIRIVLPDYIQGGENANYQGIMRDPEDYETITGYVVKYPDLEPQIVKPDYMQHRKLGWDSDVRGTGMLFSVASHLRNAETLLAALTKCAEAQARIAAVREHDSPKEAVQQFRTDIGNLPANQIINAVNTPVDVVGNTEHYNYGSILDLPETVKLRLMSEGLKAGEFIEVLRATLRAVACRFGLNEHVLSQDSDAMAAYSASLVQESPMARVQEKLQARVKNWDLKLFDMIGIDCTKVNVMTPEVIWRKDTDAVQVADFLLLNKIASKKSIAKLFEIDYEEEISQIHDDEKEFPPPSPEEENTANEPFLRRNRGAGGGAF